MWGTTAALFVRPNFSLHLLEIKAGGYCSEHRHERKLNHFYVLSGKLEVTVWLDGGGKDSTVMEAGQGTAVPVGLWHMFRAVEDTICLEIYEAAPVEEDIVRRTTGGFGR